jgi:hypothetical protein
MLDFSWDFQPFLFIEARKHAAAGFFAPFLRGNMPQGAF